jgi:hypothetical protein
MNQILEEYLMDAYHRVDMYKKELEEYNVINDDLHGLIELCIEANFQATHDILLNEHYFEYNQWMKENKENVGVNQNNNSYCKWLKKIKKEEDEEYLRRYNRRMKKV